MSTYTNYIKRSMTDTNNVVCYIMATSVHDGIGFMNYYTAPIAVRKRRTATTTPATTPTNSATAPTNSATAPTNSATAPTNSAKATANSTTG